MQFLQLLRKLNASQQSLQKVVGYAIKYGSKCGEDLWECIFEECAKVCPSQQGHGLVRGPPIDATRGLWEVADEVGIIEYSDQPALPPRHSTRDVPASSSGRCALPTFNC